MSAYTPDRDRFDFEAAKSNFFELRELLIAQGATGDLEHVILDDLSPEDYRMFEALQRACTLFERTTTSKELDALLEQEKVPFRQYHDRTTMTAQDAKAKDVQQQQSRKHFAQVLLNEMNAAYLKNDNRIAAEHSKKD